MRIRRTIVVEYESALSLDAERTCALQHGIAKDGWGAWLGYWPAGAEIRETVESLTEDSRSGPDGCSRRVE